MSLSNSNSSAELANTLYKNLLSKVTSMSQLPECPINLLNKEDKIDGTDVYVYISVRHHSGITLSLTFFDKYVFDGNTDSSLKLHQRLYHITDDKCTLTNIKRRENKIIENLSTLLDEYKSIKLQQTVVAKKLMNKDEYQTHLQVEKLFNESSECYICYDSSLSTEKLNCGHHIHSHCLSQYCSTTNFEDINDDDYDATELSSFRCGYCRKHTHAPVWN
jgi:hypothetical protein